MTAEDDFYDQLDHLATILNPHQRTAAPGNGVCPTCGRTYQLKTDGTLRKHWARDGMGKGLPFSDQCGGSGRPPKEQQ